MRPPERKQQADRYLLPDCEVMHHDSGRAPPYRDECGHPALGGPNLPPMSSRFAFVTIGQTPRTDLMPDILRYFQESVAADELGVLDDLDSAALAQHAPGHHEARLVTRLRDGSQVVLQKAWVQEQLQALLDSIDPEPYTAIVLLCTGEFPGLRGPGLFLDAQHLVDSGVAALATGAKSVGAILPLPEQAAHFHFEPAPGQELQVTNASPYEGSRFEEAGTELSDVDLIVMHCIGYTEFQRRAVATASGRPVLLARRLVASALTNLL